MEEPLLAFIRPVSWLACRAYFRIRHEGVSHVPLDGPLLITPNHVSYADPVFVGTPVRRPIHYMAWERLFQVPLLKRIIPYLNAFPVNTDETDTKAIRSVVRLLDAGKAILIFPEGGRSVDGRLQPFKSGAFRLALTRNVPVLPVTIAGAWKAWPPHQRFPRPGRVTVTFHPPIDPKEIAPAKSLKLRAQLMADRVYRQVATVFS
ncbi:MAG TPA: lysophospholipid acyltransferase family protein [Methylomirabilota bacterium]|nr:lysophospholipid acyltransferase family protein [Methylomirabilota bacterium]